LSALRVTVLGAAVGSVTVLTIAYVADRYLGDSLPLVILCALAGMYLLISWLTRIGSRRLTAAVSVVLAALGVFGLWANLSVGLAYQRLLSPHLTTATRTGFVSIQQQLDATLHGGAPSKVAFGADLPVPAPVYHLFVVGDCDGLYWSDGSQWLAVEQSNSEGHFRLQVTFPTAPPGTRQPLLVAGVPGHAVYLTVDYRGRGSVSFDYLDQDQGLGWFSGGAQKVQPGSRYLLDVVLDRRLGIVSVRAGDKYLLDAVFGRALAGLTGAPQGAPTAPQGSISLGQAPSGGPVASQFTGQIQNLPVDQGICRSLQARSRKA
jgi:hypothetical protein